jgi:hypothetical protein
MQSTITAAAAASGFESKTDDCNSHSLTLNEGQCFQSQRQERDKEQKVDDAGAGEREWCWQSQSCLTPSGGKELTGNRQVIASAEQLTFPSLPHSLHKLTHRPTSSLILQVILNSGSLYPGSGGKGPAGGQSGSPLLLSHTASPDPESWTGKSSNSYLIGEGAIGSKTVLP